MQHLAEPFDRSRLKAGENRLPCPKCDRGERDRALSVRLQDDGRALWNCHRCGFHGASGGELQAPRARAGRPARKAQDERNTRQPARTLSAWGTNLWRASMPIGGAALAYLEARACAIPPADGHLRWIPSHSHPSGYRGPALVALITDALTGEAISLHRTWIRPNGAKAPVEPARLYLADHRKHGGVVRCWPEECVTEGLGICEGLESGLSLAHAGLPVWACLDAGNLADFPVLDGIASLVIAADHDSAGVSAAEKCAARWAAAGRSVRIVKAEREGADLNDLVKSWAT